MSLGMVRSAVGETVIALKIAVMTDMQAHRLDFARLFAERLDLRRRIERAEGAKFFQLFLRFSAQCGFDPPVCGKFFRVKRQKAFFCTQKSDIVYIMKTAAFDIPQEIIYLPFVKVFECVYQNCREIKIRAFLFLRY